MGSILTPEEVQQLAEEGVVQSVKWSTAEVSRIRDTKFLCGPAFPVFVGNDLIAFEGLAVGADGWISCLPMIVPSRAVKLYRLLAVEKNLSAARELFYPLVPLIRLEFRAASSPEQRSALAGRDPGVGPFAWYPRWSEPKTSFCHFSRGC